jgi:DNA modification methylase
MGYDIAKGDCLELLKDVPDGSIDMILADPPYGTTACKWDSIIPLEPMWEQIKRVIKPNGAIVMTASQPFTTTLISSNMKMFKYCWVYRKALPTGHLNAKRMPLRGAEDVVVFYSKPPTYNPQKTTGHKRKVAHTKYEKEGNGEQCYGKEVRDTKYNSVERYPTGIIDINNAIQKGKVHPTQKPVALMEYLIKTYTNKGESVLDFTMGSGTTGVACINTKRYFMGFELDEKFFNIARDRLTEAYFT